MEGPERACGARIDLAASLAAIDLGASQGTAVLSLLERANVPPLPAFYTLLYNYVAGVQGLFSTRVRDILAEGERGSSAVGERLYAEFVEPYESNEAFERAVERITSRLQTLDVLLTESARASAEQSASLEQANTHFSADTLDVVLLKDWVRRLHATNTGMKKANSALATELRAAQSELDQVNLDILRTREDTLRDPLTGLANRAGLDLALNRMLREQYDTGKPMCCGVIDIDHFKSLNDRYGHPVGDEVLRIVSRAILVSARTSDVIGRPGGDEFIVIFPDTDLQMAHLVAERIRSDIVESDLRAVLGNGVLGGITASIGVAPLRQGDSITHLVDRADRSLFEAKRQGRNRVMVDADRAA